jgi:hypothetical protein
MRFRLIADYRDVWPVRLMCDALSVSPSGFYAWRSRPESARKIANRELLVDIRRVHAQHRDRYGAPRIHAELRGEGHTVSRKRVARLMRRHGIRARAPRRYRVCTTDSKHSLPVAENLLDQNFIAGATGNCTRSRQNAQRKPFIAAFLPALVRRGPRARYGAQSVRKLARDRPADGARFWSGQRAAKSARPTKQQQVKRVPWAPPPSSLWVRCSGATTGSMTRRVRKSSHNQRQPDRTDLRSFAQTWAIWRAP